MNRICSLTISTLVACVGPRFERVGAPRSTVSIDRVELQWSNVYLVRDHDAIALVDTGSPVDKHALVAALADRGVDPGSIRVVVVTHAHADHAGLARWLQTEGAKVVLGAEDARAAARGYNDPLPATGLLAGWLAPLFMFSYEPFSPDIVIDHEIDLGEYGLPDLHVVPVPGHTPGSLAVVVGTEAITGDLFKGGWFAKIFPHVPSEHYYQTDVAADHRAVAMLLERGVQRFHIGHGGQVDADDVKRWLRTADDRGPSEQASIEVGASGELRRGGGDALGGLVRIRFGIGRTLGYLGGVDVNAADLGGARLAVDLHVAGLALRDRAGAFVALTGGIGVGGIRGLEATHVPVELSAELPLGPVRMLARCSLGWRLGGMRYVEDVHGVADELSTLVGVRLGRDHAWGNVLAGLGPYVAATYRDLGGVELYGLVVGVELWSGD